jgi:hypothetical protein
MAWFVECILIKHPLTKYSICLKQDALNNVKNIYLKKKKPIYN